MLKSTPIKEERRPAIRIENCLQIPLHAVFEHPSSFRKRTLGRLSEGIKDQATIKRNKLTAESFK